MNERRLGVKMPKKNPNKKRILIVPSINDAFIQEAIKTIL